MRRNQLKYPEQVKIRAKLSTGDKVKLAVITGYKEGTIREMLNGYRKMTDPVKLAIITLINERQNLDKELEQIINQ